MRILKTRILDTKYLPFAKEKEKSLQHTSEIQRQAKLPTTPAPSKQKHVTPSSEPQSLERPEAKSRAQ